MPGLAEAFERIGLALERHLPVSHAAGAAIAVTDRHETLGVVVRGFADVASGAPVRPETRFMIGSISKSFAAIVALQEVEAGRLDLQVSVNELLPWLALPEPFGSITMHHLLTHTSGLAAGTEDAPTGLGAATLLRSVPPTFAPGEHFWYSNDAYKLVGLVLEQMSGRPIHELIHERVLEPLGMTASVAAITEDIRTDLATGYEPVFTDRPAQLRHPLVPATFTVSCTADGSIVSNVIDMAAHARLLLNRGRGPEEQVLSEAMFDVLTTPFVEQPDDPGTSYGYGLDIGEDEHGPWLGHGGGMVGYTAFTVVEPASGLGVVILQNGSGAKEGVLRYAFDAVRASISDVPLPEVWSAPEPTAIPEAAAFAGEYVDPEGGDVLRVQPDADGLRITIGEASGRLERDPLTSDAGGQFLVVHPDLERFPIRFGRGRDGRAHEAFHGNRWFRAERYDGEPPEAAPREWFAYPGLYRNDDPWMPTLRVVLRKGRLALQFPVELSDEAGEAELQPLEDGWFAAGEPWEPRRIRFDRLVDGKAVVAEFNGGRWFRSFEK
ncbi:MAG: serine hydrolase domain-containing protein [Actinomycetota bacterium]